MTDKKIVRVSIYEIKAGKHIFCGPPALWDIEATIEVTYDDHSVEVQYISTVDLGEVGWQVMTKSISAFKENERSDLYIVDYWDETKKALKSPYGSAIAKVDAIFKKIAVL